MLKKRLFTASLATTILFSSFGGAAMAKEGFSKPPTVAAAETVAQMAQLSFEEQYKLLNMGAFFSEYQGVEVTAVTVNQFIVKVSVNSIIQSYKDNANLYPEGEAEFLQDEKAIRSNFGDHIELRFIKQGNGSKKEIKYLKNWVPLPPEEEAVILDVLSRGWELERPGGYFHDTLNHEAEGYIQFLYELGVINGQSPTKFNPNGQITRAQLALMIFRAAGLTLDDFEGYTYYNDIEKHQAGKEISILDDYGLLAIFDDADFYPNKPATREEVAAVIYAFMQGYDYKGNSSGTTAFKDKNAIDPIALEGIAALQQEGIVKGYKDGTFKPKANVTRAQFSKMLALAILEIAEE
ncbi:MAG: S-layer homology domain-containing protein [Lysinibacillus sp.]